MIFEGKAIRVELDEEGIACLRFDLQDESVNKFNSLTTEELKQALDALERHSDIKGLVIASDKKVFIVGADIGEFGPVFNAGPQAVGDHLQANVHNFARLERLPFPTVAAISGYALGGGLEICLACDFRVMSEAARIGLPEVKLGIIPGWGGTVRLPRLAGVDTAVEWIASGAEKKAEEALAAKVVDGTVAQDQVMTAARNLLTRAIAGKLDYQRRRAQKTSPLAHNDIESLMAFETSKIFVKGQAGRHYPAPVAAVEAMQKAAKLDGDQAQQVETEAFVGLAKTPVAKALVGVFLNDQAVAKQAKIWEKQADKKVARSAVLGAGIMGGGIAYQSALKKVPVIMKDIGQEGLDLGLSEAAKLLRKRVERGKLSVEAMAETLTRIDASLSYDGFDQVDMVVEAVVENAKVKRSVLSEVEAQVTPDTVLASNTSTISIDDLAGALARPEMFCGMHFFNPVHAMPLVEVIRGKQSSDLAVARTVAYANALGKKAIVVKNCPGFLVNRVLFPYFAGFSMLVRDGADFQAVDKVMERWGWPMGPAYLLDVVGIDTGVHAEQVMAEGIPERMAKSFKAATDVLFEAERYGQKNNAGFYDYQQDKKGKPVKVVSDRPYELLQPHVSPSKDFEDDTIIHRMMVPMATELVRCLEEGIVATPAEADMALLYGLGFPPFRGGVLRWIDEIGLPEFIKIAEPLAELGPLYEVTPTMREMAANGKTYYEF